MTGTQLLSAALRLIGIASSEEPLRNDDLVNALEAFNLLLASWSADGTNIPANVTETFTLAAAAASYTWGLTGTLASARPNTVKNVWIRADGDDTALWELSNDQYGEIVSKSQTGGASWWRYLPTSPLGTLYFYPEPVAATVIVTESQKTLGSFSMSTIAAALTFEDHYLEPLKYNLAVRMAPEFGLEASPTVVGIANSSRDRMLALNASRKVEPVDLSGLGFKPPSHYNIYAGE